VYSISNYVIHIEQCYIFYIVFYMIQHLTKYLTTNRLLLFYGLYLFFNHHVMFRNTDILCTVDINFDEMCQFSNY